MKGKSNPSSTPMVAPLIASLVFGAKCHAMKATTMTPSGVGASTSVIIFAARSLPLRLMGWGEGERLANAAHDSAISEREGKQVVHCQPDIREEHDLVLGNEWRGTIALLEV